MIRSPGAAGFVSRPAPVASIPIDPRRRRLAGVRRGIAVPDRHADGQAHHGDADPGVSRNRFDLPTQPRAMPDIAADHDEDTHWTCDCGARGCDAARRLVPDRDQHARPKLLVRVVGRTARGADRRDRPRASLGAGVPARRQDAGDRAAGPHAHRLLRRPALAAAQGRARGVGHRPGRFARRRHRQRLCAEQDDLLLLRRAHHWRRPHRRGARQTQRRHRPARRDQGDLPAGRPAVVGQSLWLPHRAGQRRQSVRHAWRAFRATATRRRISATISAR